MPCCRFCEEAQTAGLASERLFPLSQACLSPYVNSEAISCAERKPARRKQFPCVCKEIAFFAYAWNDV